MSGEVVLRVIEGRVLPGRVAQAVTRHGGLTCIRLTCMPGTARPGLSEIRFPDPVTVAAGERVAVIIEWLPAGISECAGPAWMPAATTLACAHVLL